jgi:6-phosphogluconolactonase
MSLVQQSLDAPWGPLRLNAAAETGELNLALAQAIARVLNSSIRNNGSASLAVSGGKSPIGMFTALSTAPVDWSKVTLTLVDDRWLPPSHQDSNEALLKTHLLVNEARAAKFLGLYSDYASPEAGIADVRSRLSTLAPVLDVVVLGMGNDQHTASLFPCSREAKAGLDPHCGDAFLAVNPSSAPYPRISMSLPRIVATSALFLHIVGSEKRRVLESALADSSATSPIAQVLSAGRDVAEVFWCPDDV